MSELPWENKKVSEAMSSAGKEARITDDSGSDKNKASIPDILANAFSDMPMEEVKIENSKPLKGNETPAQEKGSFPFGDLPDLSTMSSNSEQENASINKPVKAPGGLPTFISTPPGLDSLPESFSIPSGSKPLFGFEEPGSKGMDEGHAGQASKKRAPPPLFEPSFLFDKSGPKPQPANTVPSLDDSPVPFPAIDLPDEKQPLPELPAFAPPPGTAPVNPFETASIDGQANPFAPAPSSEGPVNPFDTGPVVGQSNPFAPSPSTEGPVNPFDTGPVAGQANPFAPAPSSGGPVNPFETGPVVGQANPFAPAPSSGGFVNPFETGPVDGQANPFAPAPSSEGPVNPFESAPVVGQFNPFETGVSTEGPVNPFAQGVTMSEKPLSSGSKMGTKVPVNVDAIKKNIGNISAVAKGLFKNLTRGKSLIERMEDMRTESKTGQPVGSAPDSPFEPSPFGSEPVSAFEKSSVNPFDTVPGLQPEMEDSSQDDLFETTSLPEDEADIRRITPIENPIMEMEEIDIFDDSDMSVQGFESSDSDELHVISPSMKTEAISDHDGNDNISSFDIENISESIEASPVFSELSTEFESMKRNSNKRLKLLENDIIGFKDNLSSVDARFSSLQFEVENFSGKISKMDEEFSSFVQSNEEILTASGSKFDSIEGKLVSVEGRMGDFESDLSLLHNDNAGIKADLSRIGEDVSGLVESYTALLVQLHESLQENESNFSRIDAISVKLNEIGAKIGSIEKTQEGAKATSMEFSRSLSSMLDNIGRTSSEFLEFKEESEQKNADMLEKIESVTEYVEKELQKVGARSYKGFGQNVHLSNIVKNSSNMKLCMEWLEFLMELVGRNNLPDILSYYEELGWISEKARMELLHYADGIDFYMEKPDWKLTPDDHVKSIWFIESLAGLKVDKNRLSVIERDIEKVKKGSEIYGI